MGRPGIFLCLLVLMSSPLAAGVSVDAKNENNATSHSLAQGVAISGQGIGVLTIGGGPPSPTVIMPGAPAPQLFANERNQSGKAVSIPLAVAYDSVCNPAYTEDGVETISTSGKSGKTTIVWNSHPFYEYGKAARRDKGVKSRVVRYVAPNPTKRYYCVGFATVSGKSGAGDGYDLQTLRSDLALFATELDGFAGYLLLVDNGLIAAATGVRTDGSGWGIGSGISRAFDSLTGGAISPGYTSGKGETVADAKLSFSAIVVVPTTDAAGVVFRFNKPEPSPAAMKGQDESAAKATVAISPK